MTRVVLAHAQPFRIGEAEVRPATREILFAGRHSVIEPRVMQALVALHCADGAVVSKDDLALLCWDVRIVGEDAINRVISRLRAVADKLAGGQFRVETITKVGYRLVPSDSKVQAISETPAAGASRPPIGRRELIVGGAAVAAVAAGGIGWTVLREDAMPREARLLVDGARKSLREGDLDSAGNAIGTLRHAAELAPGSAEVWGLLAYAYMIAVIDSSAQDRPALRARGLAAINQAFALEPYQADALAAQIRTIPLFGNWYAYERASRGALRRHPSHPELMIELGGMLAEVGRLHESLQLYERAMPYMPLSADVLTSRAYLLWSLGRLEEADAAIENAFNLLPLNYGVWNAKTFYLLFSGRPREAAAMIADKETRPPTMEDQDYELDLMQANAIATGDRGQMRKALQVLVHTAESGRGFVVASALLAAFVGDLDQAFRLVNALYFNRGFKLPDIYFNRSKSGMGGERHTAYLFCRIMASVRRDPRFALLTREIGLDDYWARTNSRSQVIT